MNLHTLMGSCMGYSPICAPTSADLASGRFQVMPEWYALLMLHLLSGDRPASVRVSGRHPDLTVDALSGGSERQLDVVLVNTTGPTGVSYSVALHLPDRFRLTQVLGLSAPALEASAGTTLGGAAVSQRGSWARHRAHG